MKSLAFGMTTDKNPGLLGVRDQIIVPIPLYGM